MATLNEAVKCFIVQALACYDTPTEVADSVKAEFGIEVSRVQVAQYDPTKVAGKGVGKKWVELFHATRERFRREVAEIPIADQAYRLRQLGRLFDRTARSGNTVGAAQLLEQAAKEAGGAFTNRQKLEHTGKDGSPIKTAAVPVDLDELTDAELDLLERIAARRQPGGNPG
ncbi:DUF2280 domain-containing protein [Burkholderia sp. Ac-20384]|uniref:DUF2280 domain-containing protein n=1 Tax=Burkholderia sp. Ac-20384 TaxID=2703902 RepID=UPI0019815FE9|nr:DUF2280 domain-containing protein [Burkholderia sp. Ac-20384]MBN3822338.1 DUF2280 domain-containing protein [Burkholderia sp. Ac-20384]